MGGSLKKILNSYSKQEARILFFGLDAAGKTTILYVSKLGEVVTTIPTIGFNVETITYGNLKITAWDVGGRDKIRPLWRHYFANTSGVVFVLDSNDRERISEARDELFRMINEDELRDLPVLIFANKQDLPNSFKLDEIKEKLDLEKLDSIKRKWHLQATVATEKKGIDEGFQWLADAMRPSKVELVKPIVETMNDSKMLTNDLYSVWNSISWKTLLSKFI